MTINADCNNNKLEVSVTSNGLELMSSPVNGVVSSSPPPDDNTSDQFVSLSSTSSSSATAPSPDYHLTNNNNCNHIPETNKLKIGHAGQIDQNANAKATVKGQQALSDKPTKLEQRKSLIQRHQSCPQAKMSPGRPLTNGMMPAASAALPPLDNCDIYEQHSIATSPVSPKPPTSLVLAPPNGVFPTALNPIPPPRKPAPVDAFSPKHKAAIVGTGSTRVSQPSQHPRQQQPPIDWKAKLNHELTLYQKLLQSQSQSRQSPSSPTKPTVKQSSQPKSIEQQPRPITPTKQYQHYPQRPNSARSNPSTGGENVSSARTKSSSAKTTATISSTGSTDLPMDYSWSPEDRLSPISPPNSNSPVDKPQQQQSHQPLHNSHSVPGVVVRRNRQEQQQQQPHVKVATPYERLSYAMEHDKAWQKEIAFGRRIGLYRFRGDIGNGNFSQVKIAIHSLTKEKVAVKILDKSRLDTKTQRMLAREIRTMETLHHPNLIRIFEVIETLSKHFIVMELAPGGELFQVISSQGRFSEVEAKFYFSQILSAIDHMHQHNLIHRDIKAENVFFADSYTVKVGDFGFSTRISSQDELLSTFCGSPPYAAPELFRDESYRGPYVDYWALGVLLFFIVTGSMPFRAQTIVALKKIILECRYDIPTFVSVECCQLIAGFLQMNPLKRYSLEQARCTRWLRNRTTARSLPKYDLRSSYAKLLRQRRQSMAERRNTLSEFSAIDIDFTNRSNRFSLIESRTSPDGGAALRPAPSLKGLTNSLLSEEERKTFRQLMVLGIDDQVIVEHIDKGSISPIVGTFRIVLHRNLQESLRSAASSRLNGSAADDANGITSAGRINRSSSIHVAAFDKLFARKSPGAAAAAPPALMPSASVKHPSAKRQNVPTTVARPRQSVPMSEEQQQPLHHRALTPKQLENGKPVESDKKSESGSAHSESTKRSKFINMLKSSGQKENHSTENGGHRAGLAKTNSISQNSAKIPSNDTSTTAPLLQNEHSTPKESKVAIQRRKSNRSSTSNEEGRQRDVKPINQQQQRITTIHNTGTVTSNGSRLSRSWRTLKHLVTENNICGGADEIRGPDQRLSSNKDLDGTKHHVLHKTATLQIVPNSCAALLWSPKRADQLRRSQTTPDVSTCYQRGGQQSQNLIYPDQYHHHPLSATKKSFNYHGSNRCIIF